MSNDDNFEVGYGKPPRQHQFAPGRSGNVKGRPKKAEIDSEALEALLDQPVPVRAQGQVKMMSPREVALRKLLQKGLDGDRRALVFLLDLFLDAGVLPDAGKPKKQTSVIHLSTARMPFAMARIMAQRFGVKRHYAPAQLAQGRADYLATSSPLQVEIDRAIGYPDLVEGETP